MSSNIMTRAEAVEEVIRLQQKVKELKQGMAENLKIYKTTVAKQNEKILCLYGRKKEYKDALIKDRKTYEEAFRRGNEQYRKLEAENEILKVRNQRLKAENQTLRNRVNILTKPIGNKRRRCLQATKLTF